MAGPYYSRDTHPRVEIVPSEIDARVDVIRFTNPDGTTAAQVRMLDRANWIYGQVLLELYDAAGYLSGEKIALTEGYIELRHDDQIDIGSPAYPPINMWGQIITKGGLRGRDQEGISRGIITNFERGRVPVSFSGVNFRDTSLTYAVPFPATPTIQTTCVEGAASPIGNWSTQVFNASATGCTVRIRDFTLTNRTGSVNFEYWACL